MQLILAAILFLFASQAHAEKIPYNPKITMKVGQTVTLKGVRTQCDGKRAPSYVSISNRFPKLKIGYYKDGGKGTVMSGFCKKEVPARAVLFKATKKGRTKFKLFKDSFDITVR